MMTKLTSFILCSLVALSIHAQYSGPGYYRVHNAGSDGYICIKGTHFEKTTRPDAFWPCVLMQKDSNQVADPGSIIYIPDTIQVGLYAQGVDTYSLTGLLLDVKTAPIMREDRPTYTANTVYNGFNCVFRDYGNGMTAGSNSRKPEANWWIEPVNEASIDTSYLGVRPVARDTSQADDCYWATMCCDFPILIPEGSGVEGAYTINEVKMGSDSVYYAEPVKRYAQGDTVPAATPVLFKCSSPHASGNKISPVGDIANHREMPIASDLLMGNYFSDFVNHGDLIDYDITTVYVPEQATPVTARYLALGLDGSGAVAFVQQQEDGKYMAANSAWLNLDGLDLDGVTAVRLGTVPTIVQTPRGDVNGDYVVDVSDVTLIIHEILHNSTNTYKPQFDVNQDNVVDVSDVTATVGIILGTTY